MCCTTLLEAANLPKISSGRASNLLHMQATLHQGQELTCCTALLEAASLITDLTLHGRLALPGICPLCIQGFQDCCSLRTACHLSLQGFQALCDRRDEGLKHP